MTHDELLAKIDWVGNNLNGNATYSSLVMATVNSLNALRAVVELHKPNKYNLCEICRWYMNKHKYPCPTIQAIEKELK